MRSLITEWYGKGERESEGGKEEGRVRKTRREGEREGEGGYFWPSSGLQ